MKFQQRCPKSALRAVATSLLFLTTFSRGLLGDVVLETGFEGSSGLPVGWSLSQISGSATVKFQTGGGLGRPSSANSGSNNATIYAQNFSDNITRLITPTFDTVGYTTVTLSFYHAQPVWVYEGISGQDELKVFYSDDGGSSWTELAHYTDDIPNWTQRTLNLPSMSANSRIAFEGNAKWGYGVSLDDIAVTGSPSLKSTFSVTTTDGAASETGPDSGTWTITRTGNTSDALSVDYILSGSATAGLD